LNDLRSPSISLSLLSISFLSLYLYLFSYSTPLQIILWPPNKYHIYSHKLNYIHPIEHTEIDPTEKSCTRLTLVHSLLTQPHPTVVLLLCVCTSCRRTPSLSTRPPTPVGGDHGSNPCFSFLPPKNHGSSERGKGEKKTRAASTTAASPTPSPVLLPRRSLAGGAAGRASPWTVLSRDSGARATAAAGSGRAGGGGGWFAACRPQQRLVRGV
jgi:hypothetical protein